MYKPTLARSKKAWNWVSSLPIEQSLVVGGGGTIAFLEVLSFAHMFLEDNINSVLNMLYGTPLESRVKTVADRSSVLAPLMARKGLVEAMLLTPIGIFFLRADHLTLYKAQIQNDNDETSYYYSKLSPSALGMYNTAITQSLIEAQNNLTQNFSALLDDCLLHMLLNDLALLLSTQTPSQMRPIKQLALDLIQRITGPPPPAQKMLARFTSAFTKQPSSHIKPSSNACLQEWAKKGEKDIANRLKQLLDNSHDLRLFYKKSHAVNATEQRVMMEGLLATGCMWNQKIGNLSVELEVCSEEAGSRWNKIAKLRYRIDS